MAEVALLNGFKIGLPSSLFTCLLRYVMFNGSYFHNPTEAPSLYKTTNRKVIRLKKMQKKGYGCICHSVANNFSYGRMQIWILFAKDVVYKYEYEYYSWHLVSQIWIRILFFNNIDEYIWIFKFIWIFKT